MGSRIRVPVAGRTAYVSGAGSGIGQAVARRLSAMGCPLALVDIAEDGLAATVDAISTPVIARRLDVRDGEAQREFAAEVARWAPAPLGMVFNNAGVEAVQRVAEAVVEDDERVLDVNLRGVVHGVRAFLPILLAQRSGAIVNTSSVLGLVGMPRQSAYCASKFGICGYTEALRLELRGTGVRAATVLPAGVKTGFTHDQARTTPERAAEVICAQVQTGKTRILVGPDARFVDLLARITPTHAFGVLLALAWLGRLRERHAPAARRDAEPAIPADEDDELVPADELDVVPRDELDVVPRDELDVVPADTGLAAGA